MSKLTNSSTLKWIFTLTSLGIFIFVLFQVQPPLKSDFDTCLSTNLQESLHISEKVYQEYQKKRDKLVKGNPKGINPWKPHVYPYDYFLATFNCPFVVQRIGALGDGGKWVCGIERYQNQYASPCVIYSFGISTETTFEVEMLQKTNCDIFAYDKSVNKVIGIPDEFKHRVHFFKIYGGDKNEEGQITLGEAMARNGHNYIDILKMDVEKSEFKMFKQIISEFGNELPFSQLLLEIHTNMSNGSSFAALYDFFLSLESAGLRPFRNELNIAPMVNKKHSFKAALSEYSFLNINRICKN